jgi:DNA-binding LytR/AlgR family response regulator
MINIAIVDDEPEFASLLESSLLEYFKEEQTRKDVPFHIDVYPSAILFLEKCSGYNIIFMDIDLPIINGLTASKELREKNQNAILIYCTNYARFAVDGYQYNASDYLIKPVNKQHLKMTMDKAVESIESMKKSSITISSDKSKKIVKLDEIQYIEV